MVGQAQKRLVPKDFFLRTITKAGGSRYISLKAILPGDWKAVRVSVESLKDGVCILKLIQIK